MLNDFDKKKICNENESNKAALDAAGLPENFGRGVKLTENGEFLSMNLGDYDKAKQEASDEAFMLIGGGIDAFLDEPVDAEIPDALEIDPDLAAEWERKLEESFKNDPIAPDSDEPPLHAVRKCRPHRIRKHEN